MALRLHNTRRLDDNTTCFSFIFEDFSSIGASVYSKPFNFAASRWRLQGGIKGGKFGVFLRWLGGGQYNDKVKCKIRCTLEVINNRDPSKSVRAGNANDVDEFPKVGFGVGWSSLITTEEIQRLDSGFLDENSLFVEIKCSPVNIVFEDKLVINVSSRTSYVTSSKFSLHGEEWYLVLYPKGEPRDNNEPNADFAAAYLHREEPSMLRFKATYSIYVRGGREVQVTHHFCDSNASTAFGIEKFVRSKDLKAISKGGMVSIGVKITSIDPYYYFGFDTTNWSPPNNMGNECFIDDAYPLAFKPGSNDKKTLDFSLMFDPKSKHADLEDSAYYVKIQWSVRLFCFKDDNRSVTGNSWDVPGRSAFCFSQDEMTMNTSLELNEVLNPYSPYLDDEKHLCVQLMIKNTNEVYDPLLINSDKHSVAKLREMNAQTKAAVEKFWKFQLENATAEKDQLLADKDEELAAREEELKQKEQAIQALEKEISESNEYLAEIESTVDEIDGKKVSSIKDLVQEAQPEQEQLQKQQEVAEKLKAFMMEHLPFTVSRISVVGSAGQGTSIKGYQELDLAVFVKDLPRTEHKSWLPAIVFTFKTLLKQEGSRSAENSDDEQLTATKLPPCLDFVTTQTTVEFKCNNVNVVVMPINDWEPIGGFEALYKQSMSQPADGQMFYNVAVCERQTEFISKQNPKCKDLIRIVKNWTNTVSWRNTSSKPSHYLLSLLITAAYQVVNEGGETEAVRADKDVFLELADMVGDESLEVFWNEYYLADDYPREHHPIAFKLPIVQDPAIPTHNVASVGLEDWAQFRRELSKWVAKLTL
ncbi:uncharacterized protein [Montipora foliosa]|uniref:uncharacterized protein n=1 Tax=Montipora foliosa TaxID=591990 RepID=UPI0035F1E041